MKRSLILAVVGLCLVAGTASAGSLILATSSRAGNPDLFLIDDETGDTFNLTRHLAFDAYPTWSPDGKQIAFASVRGKFFNIYTIDPDGTNLKQLTNEEAIDRVPTYSPDGKKIAFSRRSADEEDGGTHIHVMDADGSNVKRIQENGFDPAWSPDGKKIAFTSGRNGGAFHLFVMDADGGNVSELTTTDNPIGFVYPAWSPDSKRIAYTESVGDALEIVAIDGNGKNAKQLTTLGGLNTYAAWSPDGKKILFQHHDPNRVPGPVYVMDSDGTNPKVVSVLKSERFVEGGRHVWKPK